MAWPALGVLGTWMAAGSVVLATNGVGQWTDLPLYEDV